MLKHKSSCDSQRGTAARLQLSGNYLLLTAGKDNKDKPAGNQRSRKNSAYTTQPADQDAQPPEDEVAGETAQTAVAAEIATKADVVSLLTPVDLIKKSSSNRLKQKQAKVQPPAQAADVAVPSGKPGSAAADAGVAAAAPGKKVATRGRNANLQIVEVEPKAKPGKRKAATDKTQQPVTNPAPGRESEQEQSDSDTLPNRKRAKASKSVSQQPIAEETLPARGQPEAASGVFKDVPGLPGVRHQIPQLTSATVKSPAQPNQSPQPVEKTNAPGNGRKGATKSGNSKPQVARLTVKSGSINSAEPAAATAVSQPAAAIPHANLGPQVIDQPKDRSAPGAQQNTLATGDAQAVQFHTLQVSAWRPCVPACCTTAALSCWKLKNPENNQCVTHLPRQRMAAAFWKSSRPCCRVLLHPHPGMFALQPAR